MRVRTATAVVAGLIALAGCASSAEQASPGGGGSNGPAAPSGGVQPGGPQSVGTTTGPSIGSTASAPAVPSGLAKAAAATCPTSTSVEGTDLPGAQAVPAGVAVSFVLRCKILSPGGTPTTLVAERSTSSTAALVKSLQAPSQPRAKVVCPLNLAQLPYFALVMPDGKVLVPKIPLNNCGKAQSDVITALNTLQFSQISSRALK